MLLFQRSVVFGEPDHLRMFDWAPQNYVHTNDLCPNRLQTALPALGARDERSKRSNRCLEKRVSLPGFRKILRERNFKG